MASVAARKGFKIEKRVEELINSGHKTGLLIINAIARIVGFSPKEFKAQRVARRKSDVLLRWNNEVIGISIKSFRPDADYNHVERNYVDYYKKRWNLPDDVYIALKLFVGEVNKHMEPISKEDLEQEANSMSFQDFKQEAEERLKKGLLTPHEYRQVLKKVSELREKGKIRKGVSPGLLGKMRRIRFTKMDVDLQKSVLDFFTANKERIVNDVLCGDDEELAIFLVVRSEGKKTEKTRNLHYYVIGRQDFVKIYSFGCVKFTGRGNLMIGQVELQRKGGNRTVKNVWRDIAANQLQFKIRPSLAACTNYYVCSEILHLP